MKSSHQQAVWCWLIGVCVTMRGHFHSCHSQSEEKLTVVKSSQLLLSRLQKYLWRPGLVWRGSLSNTAFAPLPHLPFFCASANSEQGPRGRRPTASPYNRTIEKGDEWWRPIITWLYGVTAATIQPPGCQQTTHSKKGAEKVLHQATNCCTVFLRWQHKFELLFKCFVSSNVSKSLQSLWGKGVHACSLSVASWAECAGRVQRAAVQRHAINLQHLSRWAGGSRKQEHHVQHRSVWTHSRTGEVYEF